MAHFGYVMVSGWGEDLDYQNVCDHLKWVQTYYFKDLI